ncbi:MAG: hypothetical protein GY814_08925 [Gammaproteobacteria bacterium]|nr:hypothetical protein [Gammaproteobacteria bacterium]
MTKIKSLALCAVASMVILGTTTANAATNLLTNGNFEDIDITLSSGYLGASNTWDFFNASDVGWNGSNIEIWKSGYGGVNSFDGGQHAEINSHGTGAPFSIYQTFNTVAGQSYQFDFAYRARSNSNEWFQVGANAGTATTTSGSGDIFSQLVDDHVTGLWSTFTETFVATSDLTTIFFHTDYSGLPVNLIDGVSAATNTTAVPAPAAVRPFGPAFAGPLGCGRRKTQ